MNLGAVLEAMQTNPLTRLQKEDVVDVYIDEENPDVQEQNFKDDYMDLIEEDDVKFTF